MATTKSSKGKFVFSIEDLRRFSFGNSDIAFGVCPDFGGVIGIAWNLAGGPLSQSSFVGEWKPRKGTKGLFESRSRLRDRKSVKYSLRREEGKADRYRLIFRDERARAVFRIAFSFDSQKVHGVYSERYR